MRILIVVSAAFLAALVCVCSAAPEELRNNIYSNLGGDLKKFVDLTIVRANQKLNYGIYNRHLNYEGTGPTLMINRGGGVAIDVRLRKTSCSKATGANAHKHRPSSQCPFLLLQVQCLVCSRRGSRQALVSDDLFIDCIRRKDAHTRHATWNASCSPAVIVPDLTLLSAKDPNTGTTDLSTFIQNPSAPVIKASTSIREAAVQSLRVFKGSRFMVECAVQARLPNSFFRLTLDDAQTRDKEAAVSGYADFEFPAADLTHQGTYRCAYEVTGDAGQTLTYRSDPFSLAVYYYDSDDYSDDYSHVDG